MLAYSALTRRGKVARLRRLARSIVPDYSLAHPRLSFISHGFNTTFCLSAQGETPHDPSEIYAPHQYLLRVHRHGFHGEVSHTRAVVQSEMQWLAALRQDARLAVPDPLATNEGVYTTIGQAEGVPDVRVCSVLRWLKGRSFAKSPKPIHLYHVGALTAQLHNHAAEWTIPAGFVRPKWDWEALFGEKITFTTLPAPEVWAIVPASYRAVFEQAAAEMEQAMDRLGISAETWGLIHADLHLDNMLFANGEARPIDFDDSGFGFWLYDIAVALWELRLHNHWPAFRQAFLEGYARYRPLPYDQLHDLDAFIAGREATIALGTAADTRIIPAYLPCLEEEMRASAEWIQAIGRQ